MPRIIFSNRITGNMLIYIAAICAIVGAAVFWIDEGRNSILVICGTLGGTVLLLLLFWIVIHFSSRSLIAELILRDDALQVEMVDILGKGRKIEMPIPPASDWNWYSQKSDSQSTERVGVITFKSGGRTYQMSLNDAKVVDEVELHKLAPNVVDEMIASKVMIHKPV